MIRLLFSIFTFLCLNSTMSQNRAIVHTDLGKTKIDKNIYGHFAEHLGACIYNGIYVGKENKVIPNTEGVRNDIIDALKKLKVPVLRWPGGCFADTYNWKDGVGPQEKRPSMVNRWWGGVTEDNSFGTHDFLNLCERIGAEPYLAGNIATASAQDLIDWDQYVNSAPGSSPMAKWREENGRKEPWKVKFWGVGNEAWGCGGNMTPDFYSDRYKLYATFLSAWDNSTGVFRIASGASDGDYNWTETLMKKIPRNLMEGIALHHYSVLDWGNKGPATGFNEDQYARIIKNAWDMEELVTRHSTIMDRYDPQKRVALVVDEWGGWYDVEKGTNPGFLYQQNTMRDAVIAGMTLNIFNNHAERVRMANLAQIVNVLQAVILTDKEKLLLTPTYHVMEMYNVHQDATLLPTELTSANYEYERVKVPALSVSSSKSKDGKTHISVTNAHMSKAQDLTIDLRGGNYSKLSGKILTSGNVNDHNSFTNVNKISTKTYTDAKLKNNQVTLKVPPFSVVVLELQ